MDRRKCWIERVSRVSLSSILVLLIALMMGVVSSPGVAFGDGTSGGGTPIEGGDTLQDSTLNADPYPYPEDGGETTTTNELSTFDLILLSIDLII